MFVFTSSVRINPDVSQGNWRLTPTGDDNGNGIESPPLLSLRNSVWRPAGDAA